jgi:F-type H+-transporting ATPase subunit delta
MLDQKVARRYAEAAFSLAKEQNQIDLYQQQLSLVLDSLEAVPEFKSYFYNFLVPLKEKKEILAKIFQADLSVNVLDFLFLLVDKRREAYLEGIVAEFGALADESRNIKNAELYTASELPKKDLKALEMRLNKATGKKIRLNAHVDPELLGGVKLRIEDRIIDATLKKRLQLLGAAMKKKQVVK